MSRSQDDFVGRENDLQELLHKADCQQVKVIYLWGESGIGKTALAYHVYERAGRFRKERKVAYSAFAPQEGSAGGEPEDWLILDLAKELLTDFNPKAQREELVGDILKAIEQDDWLVLLDNVETLKHAWLNLFISKWVSSAHKCLLILTCVAPPIDSQPQETFFLKQVEPIDETKDLVELLGSNLTGRFKQSELVETARTTLRGNPRLLRYLRWLEPTDQRTLEELVEQLAEEGGAGTNLVGTIQSRVEDSIVHVLALGRVQSVEFEEQLLFWLWDKLTGAGLEGYSKVRDQLVGTFLTPLIKDQTSYYRIHPLDHVQLDRALNDHIGPALLSNVEYYLSEYYREEFHRQLQVQLSSETERHDGKVPRQGKYQKKKAVWEGLENLLRLYVHHAILGRNIAGVFEYLFQPVCLRVIHHMGFSFGLRPVLAHLESYLAKRLDEIPNRLKYIETELHRLGTLERMTKKERTNLSQLAAEQSALRNEVGDLPCYAAETKIEVAHCLNDLSDHRKCLQTLEESVALLEDVHDNEVTRALMQRINYLRGISLSDLGRPSECIRAYAQCVTASPRDKKYDHLNLGERGILALSYLAFEFRFEDLERGLHFGRRSLRLAEQHGNSSLIAKAKCNLAQVSFFGGRIEDAARFFREAEDLCRKSDGGWVDIRELGRVVTYHSMIFIHQKNADETNLKTAEELLAEGIQINEDSRDRRRVGSALALQGLVQWHRGKDGEAKHLLDKAIQRHSDIGDWRNIIFESLSYAYMLGHHTLPEIYAAADQQKNGQEPWAQAVTSAPTEARESFGDFWKRCYRPCLLELP